MNLLPSLNLPPIVDSSTANMATDFYEPALSVSVRYDRGVGFFSSGWLRVVAKGPARFLTDSINHITPNGQFSLF
jgi:hypothetical protein